MMGEGEGFDSEEEPYRVRKFWQVREAEAELPFVKQVIEEIRYLMKQSVEMHVHIGLEDKIAQRVSGLRNRGIEIKDLSAGLVDFVALRDGEIVYLCWQEGEEKIQWWHAVSGGFQTRRRLTQRERTGKIGVAPAFQPQQHVPGYQ